MILRVSKLYKIERGVAAVPNTSDNVVRVEVSDKLEILALRTRTHYVPTRPVALITEPNACVAAH